MLHSEDLQLTQDSASEPDVTSVLVATHGNSSSQKMVNPTEEQVSFVKLNVPMLSQYDVSAHGNATQQSVGSSQQSFMPQQHFVQFSRNPGKGKGYKGGRYPRDPCAICGRTNHITNFCYYKNQAPSFDQSTVQWRSGSNQSSPWVYPVQGGVVMPQQVQFSGNANGVSLSQPHQLPQAYQISGPIIPNVSGNFVGFNQGMIQPQNQFLPQEINPFQNQFVTPQAHFTGVYSVPYMTPHTSGLSNVSNMASHTAVNGGMSTQSTLGQSSVSNGVSQQPWYFDSGATHHITNSLQNLSVAQPVANKEGILVGNGNTLPVTHTGQDNSSNSIQGSMPQGLVSYSELL
ncbi:hypothetical protein Vadar_024476 [Vaccinium darrowii]|uniref:Uncharacterized protein n=1 Tax=Vaccinium darrowii TaxID=229202 RepID=A0ACB7Y304_9ERIC|nr:hypothetical protein Vadar_024476 [Vaccinium darrowii]